VGPKLNGAHQLLAHADDVNILGDIMYTKQKKYKNFDAGNEVGLEVNAVKTKYMTLFCLLVCYLKT
jgi:hypothetical protein